MKIKITGVFFMVLCNFFVECSEDKEYRAIENAIASLSKVVVTYKAEFDTSVRFGALQNAISTLNTAMLDYEGTAKNNLNKLRELNSIASQTYTDCVGPVFEWCVSLNRTLDVFIPYINDPSLTDSDKDIIWKMTTNVLKNGQNKATGSIELLKSVRKTVANLKTLLDNMLHELHYDFGPNGYYGKLKSDLEYKIDQREAAKVRNWIFLLFLTIANFILSPINYLFLTLNSHKLTKDATYEEQLEAIEDFFNAIDEKLQKAIKVASQVQADLDVENTKLHALAGYIQAADNNKRLLLVNSVLLRAKLIPSFRDLGKNCYEYSMRHGFGSDGYQHEKTRRRRQASDNCDDLRLNALNMITELIPTNSTLEKMIPTALSIINNMDCNYMTIILPSKHNQPSMHFDYNSGETSTSDNILSPFLSILSSKHVKDYLKHVQ